MADPNALALIQEERFDDFNQLVDQLGGQVDLSNGHFRGYNLRKCHLKKANLKGAYLRSADLRGVDLSEAQLQGATIKEARVSGVLFPRNLSAQELRMALQHGTCLRVDL